MAADPEERKRLEDEEETMRILDVIYFSKIREQAKTFGKALEESEKARKEQAKTFGKVLKEKNKALEEKDKSLEEKDKSLEEMTQQIAELKRLLQSK
jgi:septal ring factor EnvC (AmiA/AmiB activator)